MFSKVSFIYLDRARVYVSFGSSNGPIVAFRRTMVASDSLDRRRRLVSSLSPPSIGDGGLLHAVDTSLGPHQISLKNRHYSPIIMHVESPPRY